MKEQYEMCSLRVSKGLKFVFSSSGTQKIKFDSKNIYNEICNLLAEGWEPFQSDRDNWGDYNYIDFRRRVS